MGIDQYAISHYQYALQRSLKQPNIWGSNRIETIREYPWSRGPIPAGAAWQQDQIEKNEGHHKVCGDGSSPRLGRPEFS